MNKIIKSNMYYFCLISFATYISLINLFIYDYYWNDKINSSFGKLDYLKDEVFGEGLGIPIDILDYSSYGPSLDIIARFVFTPYGAIAFCFFVFIAAIMYIIIPLFFMYFDSALKIVCIVLDIIWGILYFYFYISPSIKYPLSGFIPMCILAPMLFFIMIWFRFKQYKNIYVKEKVQKNE